MRQDNGRPVLSTVLEVDGRRQVSLAGLARPGQYLAHREPDGTIVLTPAFAVPARDVEETHAFRPGWPRGVAGGVGERH